MGKSKRPTYIRKQKTERQIAEILKKYGNKAMYSKKAIGHFEEKHDVVIAIILPRLEAKVSFDQEQCAIIKD